MSIVKKAGKKRKNSLKIAKLTISQTDLKSIHVGLGLAEYI
jgi:hypothetical protein